MAEAYFKHDTKSLQEMGTVKELGTLRETSTLQDISLAEGDAKKRPANMGDAQNDEHDDSENESKLKSNSLKRFFRLPNKKKVGGALDNDKNQKDNFEANPIHAERSHRDLTATFSRSTLKSSLSNYWNTVFKQKKNKKSSNTNDDETNDELDEIAVGEEKLHSVVKNTLAEEIHALQISKEN